jgi:hypothetical protein
MHEPYTFTLCILVQVLNAEGAQSLSLLDAKRRAPSGLGGWKERVEGGEVRGSEGVGVGVSGEGVSAGGGGDARAEAENQP